MNENQTLLNAAKTDLLHISPEQLEELKNVSDDELLRCARSLDIFAAVESTRRLRIALHKEETAIKWLTVSLVFFTVVLTVLTLILVFKASPHL
jgi:hypothetical protein